MAKARKKPKKAEKPESTYDADALGPAMVAFRAGDYATARTELARIINDADRSEGERKMATTLKGSTKLELVTLWAGLACLGLFVLVIGIASLKQP